MRALRAPDGHSASRCDRRSGLALGSAASVKCTQYFLETQKRKDRARIEERWVLQAVTAPIAEHVQSDGRIRRWVYVAEEERYLRVVLLADGETVHNAFFDRGFRP